MTSDEWFVVKAITADALARPEDDRDTYVTTRCGGNRDLRREVESLLASVTRATDLYESAFFTLPQSLSALLDAEDRHDPVVGERIGAYRVLAQIGRGGMGAAYLAVRADEAYEKRVAIKLIKRGMDTDAILRRFRHERQILASLEHPNIVMLLDGGTTASGLPYFVMEYIHGLPIDTYCDINALPVRQRLKLFQAVCAAVDHAHQHRVIHRDLKPTNILVTASGVPKLLDFGIAKLVDPQHGLQTLEPTLLSRAMTPQYASPEQVRGEPLTASSDVYSLGVLLYVLLTGSPPYRLDGRSSREAERIVSDEVPPKAARLIVAAVRRRHGRSEPPRVPRLADLEAIVSTALRKEPGRRYSSAQALADDIQRYLDGLPVAARRDGVAERIRAFIRRPWPAASEPAAAAPRLHVRRRILGGAAALAAIILLVALTRADRPDPARIPSFTPPRSIAVLPLSNSGNNPELEYLAEGLTDDVINTLSRAPHLKVIARDSAHRYGGKAVDLQQIGRELDVDSVLTGRLAQRGATLSIATELVDTRDGRQLWGERYERTLTDVHGVQRELADRIATSLRLQFTADERARFARVHTRVAEAYQLYLKGRYFWNKRTPSGFHTSVNYFQQAVDRDPAFALAYVGLADSYALLTEYHAASAVETYPKVRAALTRALEIDPLLPEAHSSLGYLRQFYEWNWTAAEQEYRRGIELNPNYATGYQWYAEYLSAMGRHGEALQEIRNAQLLDPLSLIINAVEANLLYMAREYDRAIAKSRQVIEMDANFPEVYEFLKRAYDQKGLYRDAIAARQMRRSILGLDVDETPALRAAAAATSARGYWRNRLIQERTEAQTEGILPFEFAEILAQAGDTAGALEWLERACVEHDFLMVYVRVAPNLDPLRQAPRYQEVVRRGCAVERRP